MSFLRSLAAAGVGLVKHPSGIVAANARMAIGLGAALRATALRAVGSEAPGPVAPAAGDKRFKDQAYEDNPLYFLLEQEYLLASQLVTELLDAAELAGRSGGQGAVRGQLHPRRSVADQHPARQPGGDPAGIRHAVARACSRA